MNFLRVKRFLLILLLASAVFVSGCGPNGSDANKADNEGVINLRWLLLGPGKQYDSERVWSEFNKKLEEKLPNTVLSIDCLTNSEFYEKWRLTTASGENVDLVWTGWLVPYVSEVRKGAYMPLDSLIDAYAPHIKEELPESLFEQARVDGKIYSVPNYQMIVNNRLGIYTPKELSDKYMDCEKVEEVFLKNETMTEQCYDLIEEYLENLKNKGLINLGLSTSTFYWFATKGYEEVADPFVVRIGDPEFKIVNKFETPEVKLMFDKMADWFKKGYIRQDILALQNPRLDEGKKDKYVLWVHNDFKNSAEGATLRYKYPIRVISAESRYYVKNGGPGTATAISSTSLHPEQAMKLLGLLQSDEGTDLFNMLVYGIEGEHYKKTSDRRIQTIDYMVQPDNTAKYGLWKWAVGNTFKGYYTLEVPDYWEDYIKNEVNAKAILSPIIGFKVNTDPIKTELLQINTVVKEYENSLMHGALPNHKSYYDDFIQKMKKNGSDRIVEVIQEQIDEYVREKQLR